MASLSHATLFSKVLWIGRSSLIGRDYGMTLCRRRPAWIKDQAHPAVPHRLWMRRLDEEFCLIACMASTRGSNIWYIDNGASNHMTGHKRFFRDLQEGGTGIHIELGDDARYQA